MKSGRSSTASGTKLNAGRLAADPSWALEPGHREARGDGRHLATDPLERSGLLATADGADDGLADGAHLVLAHAAGRRGRRPDTDARRDVGRIPFERDGVLVDGDADLVEERLGVAAGHAQRRHVDERQVVVRAARD